MTAFVWTRLAPGREREDYFRYTDLDISFAISANRYDNDGVEPTDTWKVALGLALKQYSSSQKAEISLEKARMIARNLQEALMAWPCPPSDPDIRQVKFLMKYWPAGNPAWWDWL